jgi:hypothetical protein
VVPQALANPATGVSICIDPPEAMAPVFDRVLLSRAAEYGSAFDPISRTWLRKQTFYFRLGDEGANPVPRERRKLPDLPSGWERDRGPLPAGLTGMDGRRAQRPLEYPLHARRAPEAARRRVEILDEDVERQSPLVHGHVNLLGRYHFAVPEAVLRGEFVRCATPTIRTRS